MERNNPSDAEFKILIIRMLKEFSDWYNSIKKKKPGKNKGYNGNEQFTGNQQYSG